MKALLLAAVLTTATHAYALDLPPGSEQTLTGQVSDLQDSRTFILTTGEDRVLVYARTEHVAAVRVGSTVQVRGKVPTDWLKLAALELQATEVRVL